MKKLLKMIFPIKFLKSLFLFYNELKINTFDKIFFQSVDDRRINVLSKEERNPFIDLQISLDNYPIEVQYGFSRWQNPAWVQDQYVVIFPEPIFIDPATGWAITSNRELLFYSLGFSRAPYVHKPALSSFYDRARHCIELDAVLSLRDTGEENYFHFFNDVLPKLWLVMESGLSFKDLTVVVSHKLWTKGYFRFFKDHPDFSQLRWHVQKDEWVLAKKSVFCKPFTHTRKYWDKIIDFARPVPSGHPTKIFLTRSKASLRYLENIDDIQPVLSDLRFTIVDASALSFAEQVQLFARAEVLVAIHGAGLTNMIFRRGLPTRVIEIFPPHDYLPFHYIMLAKMYDFDYTPIVGEVGMEKNKGGFRLDAGNLKNVLSQ